MSWLWGNDKIEVDEWLVLIILHLACVLDFRIFYCQTFYCSFSVWVLFVFTEADSIYSAATFSILAEKFMKREHEKAWLCSQASIALFEHLSESSITLLADLTVISVFLKQTCFFHVYISICIYTHIILGGEWSIYGTYFQVVDLPHMEACRALVLLCASKNSRKSTLIL